MEDTQTKFYWRNFELNILKFRHMCYKYKKAIHYQLFAWCGGVVLTFLTVLLVGIISNAGFDHHAIPNLIWVGICMQVPMVILVLIFYASSNGFDLTDERDMYHMMWTGDEKTDELIVRVLHIYRKLIREKAFVQQNLGHAGHLSVGKIPVMFGEHEFSVWKDSLDQLVIVDSPISIDDENAIEQWTSTIPINFKGYMLKIAKKNREQCLRDLEKIILDNT